MSEPRAGPEPQREPDSLEALRASELAYRTLVELSHDLIWSVDAQGRWTFVNSAARAIYGYEPAEMLGRPFMDFETPEQAEKDLGEFARIKSGAPAFNYETIHLRKDGTPVQLSFNAVFVRDEHGTVLGTTGTAQDITERKRAEEALRLSEGRFRRIMESDMIGLLFWNATGEITAANDAFLRLVGHTQEDVRKDRLHWRDMTPLEYRAVDENALRAIATTGTCTPYEKEYFRKDGARVPILIGGTSVAEQSGQGVAFVLDISERKRAEAAQRESERELRLITNIVPGPISRVGRDLRYRFVNDHYEPVFGKPRSAVVGQPMPEVLGPILFRQIEPHVRRVLGGERVTLETQTPARTPAGGLTHWFVTFVPDLDQEKNVDGFFVVALDITARKRADEALRLEQSLFSSLLTTIPDHVYFKDRQSRFVRINDIMVRRFGLSDATEAIGKTDFDFFGEEHARQAYADEQRVMSTGEPVIGLEEKETWPDGRITWVSTTKVAVRDADGQITGLVGISRDITERRKLEEQFRQSQKMDSIGQLAGGVAHDFNNILTVIQGHVALLEAQGAASAAARESVEEIKQAAERAANLTRQLLTFSRRQAMLPNRLDLNEVVTNMARLLQRILGEDIRMELHLSPHDVVVLADAGMMEQVLLNLAVNSRDAMPRGGRLLIETATVEFDATITVRVPQARAGAFVCLSITDTGTGIPELILPRIFEPFFTTKEMGKGTGLGLATVYGIVQQHEGWIVVDSESGRGTTFQVYLPRQSGANVAPPAALAASNARGGHETILLVEDEPAVRALVTTLLERVGYRVLAAATGPLALELWREHAKEINLLVTDLVMPDGMSGFDLGAQLTREAPGLRIIYTSGYSPEIAGRGETLIPGVNFLAKPFEMVRLLHAIRAACDRATTGTPSP